MKTYQVTKSVTVFKSVDIEAKNEEDAIEKAQKLDESKWESDQFEEFNDWEYTAEELG